MREYRTAEVAQRVGIHPNTVRFYEDCGLIGKPVRRENGYRVYTDAHLLQLRLVRTAFQTEVLHNGLRKRAVAAVKAAARDDADGAIRLTRAYQAQLRAERANAEAAIEVTRRLLSGLSEIPTQLFKRKEAAAALGVTADTLRNWEMNGLITVKRRQNGYRVYTGGDLQRLRIIRALRCAGYSLEAILRMLTRLDRDPRADIAAALNEPGPREDILSACDRLLISLTQADENARQMLALLEALRSLPQSRKEPVNPTV